MKQETCEERIDRYLNSVEEDILIALYEDDPETWEELLAEKVADGTITHEEINLDEHTYESILDYISNYGISFNEKNGYENFSNYEDFFDFLNNYGLAFDYVDPEEISETTMNKGFWRYQIATGGPGYEYRFYMKNENEDEPDTTLFWFLDWFDGASREPNEEIAEAIWNAFQETRFF